MTRNPYGPIRCLRRAFPMMAEKPYKQWINARLCARADGAGLGNERAYDAAADAGVDGCGLTNRVAGAMHMLMMSIVCVPVLVI
jgi:hypothetical protein